MDTAKVRLFFRSEGGSQEPLNLFETCCRSYGETRGRTRAFSLGQSLVLYAVLLHLIEDTPEFPRRVRILRNLIEASTDELRPERMPKILDDVHRVIRDGSVEEVTSLNQAQADDEKLKAAFLAVEPGAAACGVRPRRPRAPPRQPRRLRAGRCRPSKRGPPCSTA